MRRQRTDLTFPDDLKAALKRCSGNASCSGCPYSRKKECVTELLHDSLRHIQRLTADNEKLRKELSDASGNLKNADVLWGDYPEEIASA